MQIGKILYEMRTAQNISATDLVNGICAPSSYSEYETGKNIPDFLTVNGILERLGQGIATLSAWLSREEISHIGWRDEVCDAIEKEDYKGLKEAIFGKKVSTERFIEKERRLEKAYEQLKSRILISDFMKPI